MKTLLHIDASARTNRSLSRELSARFIKEWKTKRPNDCIIRRDVGIKPPPATTEAWIDAAFTDEANRSYEQRQELKLSDLLINELVQSDIIVIGTPMYNYGMPVSLKAWIDQVIRVNKTFSFDLSRGEHPIKAIQSGKTLVILSASGEGGFLSEQQNANDNYLHPHIIKCFELLGVENHHIIAIEYQEFGDARHSKSLEDAHNAVPKLVEKLTTYIHDV
ncbi:MAG: FMN-dependent NADH-azoreductase [Moorea sp. SIO3G5]|nr:FMN-dependent NADH-azoreductase [Moorena sp. SIO3G5]